MQPYSQKYAIVSFLAPIEVGETFHADQWPPHVTIADVFAAPVAPTQVLSVTAANFQPIAVGALGETVLGTTPVILVEQTESLLTLHAALIAALEAAGAVFNVPEYTRAGFLPHITLQQSREVHEGDRLVLHSLSLIDMFPGGDWQQRTVTATHQFTNTAPAM